IHREPAVPLPPQAEYVLRLRSWSGSDVRDAGLGGAIGVAFACLYYAVAAKIGAAERGERVA
ncbi:hypothetical protein ACFQL1_20240, partial [Halomicroarcula sp. GCM10025709]